MPQASNAEIMAKPRLWSSIRGTLWPEISATSGMLNPSSKNRLIASYRKSWKVRSLTFARVLSLSHAWRKATSAAGKGRYVSLGDLDSFATASSLSGTHLDEPFLVMGKKAVLLSRSMCSQRNPSISPRLDGVEFDRLTQPEALAAGGQSFITFKPPASLNCRTWHWGKT